MTDTKEKWEAGLENEIAFWRLWLTEEKYAKGRESRMSGNKRFQFANLLPSNPLKILDVGSGPISTLGVKFAGGTLDITPVDPLADPYNALLAELEILGYPKIIAGTGEKLLDLFQENSFCMVHSANALDMFSSLAKVLDS